MKIASRRTVLRRLALVMVLILTDVTPVHSLICVHNLENVRGVRGIATAVSRHGDRSVEMLPGVTVSVRRGDFRASTTTDVDGYFTFQDLPQGDYELSADFDGFFSVRDTVRVRESAAADLVLVIELAMLMDDCSIVETVPVKRARDLQEQGSSGNAQDAATANNLVCSGHHPGSRTVPGARG